MAVDRKPVAACGGPAKAGRAVFVGIARNCAPHLAAVLENLAGLAAQYRHASYVFAVSDSKDETQSILAGWLAAGRQGRLLDLGNLEPSLPDRTARIAFARNACVDALRGREEADYDHLVVVDLDDVLVPPVSAETFGAAARWLDASPSRGGVFANGRPRYYDIWALRHGSWCPYDPWLKVKFPAVPDDAHFHDRMVSEIYARMVVIPRWLPPLRVLSAFGGIGIYKMPFTRSARYVGLDERGREICEHVTFNASVHAAGGTLHIFPALTVESPHEHSYEAQRLPNKMRRKMISKRWLATLRWWLLYPFLK